ncbi:MAG: sigma-54-dependent Fis family transcriptional regulator [Calditrichaeota bacterium]|nr:sigma-54-dependent Fis family transcriptional regulator [Calditrichota bacterium]
MKKSILIIEPDDTTRNLSVNLFGNKMQFIFTDNFQDGIDLLNENSIDGVILDIEIIGDDFSLISEIKSGGNQPFVIIAGQSSRQDLITCVKSGADDFIEKPVTDIAVFKKTVEKFLTFDHQEDLNRGSRNRNLNSRQKFQFIGQNKKILELKRLIEKVAPLDSTILLQGETGTGKEIVARMIHENGPRGRNGFFAVHCGGIPDTLLESTLFGHEKGSFTGAFRRHKGFFEMANNGTIFLDEIGDTTPSFQVKLLRILQSKEFRRIGDTKTLTTNARIVSASNRDLFKAKEEGTFREDLYYRLNVIIIRVPALRERTDDIPMLAKHFLHIYGKHDLKLRPKTIEILQKQKWRGNVRELENLIENLVAFANTEWIEPSELPERYRKTQQPVAHVNVPLTQYTEAKAIFEKKYIAWILKIVNGDYTKAARLMGMPRQEYKTALKKYEIDKDTINSILSDN